MQMLIRSIGCDNGRCTIFLDGVTPDRSRHYGQQLAILDAEGDMPSKERNVRL